MKTASAAQTPQQRALVEQCLTRAGLTRRDSEFHPAYWRMFEGSAQAALVTDPAATASALAGYVAGAIEDQIDDLMLMQAALLHGGHDAAGDSLPLALARYQRSQRTTAGRDSVEQVACLAAALVAAA